MQDVAIFWDYENCSPPSSASGYIIANNIRLMAQAYGSVKSLRAYLEITDQVSSARALALRSEFQASGVSLIDCPHNGRKEVADKMIIVDMLAYAIDNPAPSVIVLISGDRDFAYALSILRLRQYQIILVTLSNAHPSLTSQASTCIDWHSTIINPVIEPPSRTTNSPVESATNTASYRNGLSEQSSPSQSSQYTQETENIGRSDHGDLLHYLRASTSARPRRSSEAPSFSMGPRSRYESPRQDASPSIEAEPRHTCPDLASKSTTESMDSSVSTNSSPAARSISDLEQDQDSTLASETKDNVASPTDVRILSATNEQAFSTCSPKTDKSTVPALLPSIMQETPQPSPMAQNAVLETDISDDNSTSSLPYIHPIRPASAPHSLPSQSPLVPLISAVEPLASETATMLPGFPDAEALPVSVDNSTTNQQHILTVQEVPGKSVLPAVGSTSLSNVSIAMSEEICNNSGLDPPDIDSISQQSPQQSPPNANSDNQPSIMALPTQGSPSVIRSQEIIDRLPITPVISSINRASPSITDSQKTIDQLPPITLTMPSVNETSPSITDSHKTIDQLLPITLTMPSVNETSPSVTDSQKTIDQLPPITLTMPFVNETSPSITDSHNTIDQLPPVTIDIPSVNQTNTTITVSKNIIDKLPPITPTVSSINQAGTSVLNVQNLIDKPLSTLASWATYPSKPKVVVPPIFKILVDTLRIERSKGFNRPLRTWIADSISKSGFKYENTGVTKFSQYIALAESQGIVELGSHKTDAWIYLKPEYQDAPDAPSPAPVVAPKFKILVETLKDNASKGTIRPSRRNIAAAISRNGLTYKEAGVERFAQYISLAEKEGIIEVGGKERDAWISLKPGYWNASSKLLPLDSLNHTCFQ